MKHLFFISFSEVLTEHDSRFIGACFILAGNTEEAMVYANVYGIVPKNKRLSVMVMEHIGETQSLIDKYGPMFNKLLSLEDMQQAGLNPVLFSAPLQESSIPVNVDDSGIKKVTLH